jgi:dTDP-4-dehydrorhamnose reductase
MLAGGLRGLYHVFSPECLSKYDFGVQIARKFGLDPGLIAPQSVLAASLTAKRSPNLTLRVDKLTQALGESPPTVSTGLERFYELYQQGYPQGVRALQVRG